MNIAPFYVGQLVVAVDAHPQSKIKNGSQYIITACHYSPSGNPIANGASFWYVGVNGHHNWLRPEIFAPIDQNFKSISFEEVAKTEMEFISSN